MSNAKLTESRIANLKVYLNNNFRDRNFHYAEVEKYLNKENVHIMVFYYFIYSNCIIKISKGVYRIHTEFYTKKISTIYKEAQAHLQFLRLKRAKEMQLKPTIEIPKIEMPNNNFNEPNCINYLKNKGYKIMKPINQYEEV